MEYHVSLRALCLYSTMYIFPPASLLKLKLKKYIARIHLILMIKGVCIAHVDRNMTKLIRS